MDSNVRVISKVHSKNREENIHGGDVYHHAVKLDFSVNVNPLGMPDCVQSALQEAISHCGEYPDYRSDRVKSLLANVLQLKEEFLVLGNGASEIFMAVVHACHPKQIVIPVPSFYGYEYVAEAVKKEATICYYPMQEENGFDLENGIYSLLQEDKTMLFLANPNNPVGNLFNRDKLKELLEYCRAKQILVVLDECFIELCEEGVSASILSRLFEYPNVFLVRAFTKTYAIPGVRLGYGICSNSDLISKIERQLPEWNISVFAQSAAIAILEQVVNSDYLTKSRSCIAVWRAELVQGLERLGFSVYAGSANYALFKTSHPLYEQLLERGILIRDCSNYKGLGKGYYRVAVRTDKENKLLLDAIEQIVGSNL